MQQNKLTTEMIHKLTDAAAGDAELARKLINAAGGGDSCGIPKGFAFRLSFAEMEDIRRGTEKNVIDEAIEAYKAARPEMVTMERHESIVKQYVREVENIEKQLIEQSKLVKFLTEKLNTTPAPAKGFDELLKEFLSNKDNEELWYQLLAKHGAEPGTIYSFFNHLK